MKKRNAEIQTANANDTSDVEATKTIVNKFYTKYKKLSENTTKKYLEDSYESIKKNHNIKQKELSNIKSSLRYELSKLRRGAEKGGMPKRQTVPMIVQRTARKVPYMKNTKITRKINNFEIFS